MSTPDCDGSEYCRASQHIEGCFCGPCPEPEQEEQREATRTITITPRHANAIEAAARLVGVCNPQTEGDLREVLALIEAATDE